MSVSHAELTTRIRALGERRGVDVPEDVAPGLASYLELLRRWNRRMNLTAFDLDTMPDAALDRLVLESLDAATHVEDGPYRCVDVGSGAGSPAIPLKLARPRLQMTLVEVRAKRGAFLREAIRTLGLADTEVFTGTLASYCEEEQHVRATDLVTIRAVRTDPAMWTDIMTLLRPQARVFRFGGAGVVENEVEGLVRIATEPGIAGLAIWRLIGYIP